MQNPLIKATNLSKIYGPKETNPYKALDQVNLTVNENEIIGISSKSGGGKTTLLGIIGCLDTATTGTLELFGQNVEKYTDKELSDIRKKHIGFIFQEHNLIPALTVEENIELPLTLQKIKRPNRKEKIQQLLEIVELDHLKDRYPSQLSRGQRQRIAAVRAFANDPKLVLADEPTSDLDKENATVLLEFLKHVNQETGTTIIIATTDSDVFQNISTRNLRLENGKII